MEGDSLLWQPAVGAGDQFPSSQGEQLRIRLANPVSYANASTPGEGIADITAQAATQVDPLFDPTLDTNVLWVSIGSNDLRNLMTPAALFAAVNAYILARQAVGWTVALTTVLPRSQAGLPAGFEADRQTYNQLVRDNGPQDAIVDVGADANIGQPGDSDDTAWFSSDKIHLKWTGREVVAALAQTAVASLGIT